MPLLERLDPRLDGARVVEIGCGRGVGTQLLPERLGAALPMGDSSVDVVVDFGAEMLADRRLGIPCGTILMAVTITQWNGETAPMAVGLTGRTSRDDYWQSAGTGAISG
ncbi:MAG: hypothetical protein WA962_03380 [Ornithinimicrobium sp.]